jgi:beta-lactam-binding protein with PASTA domain
MSLRQGFVLGFLRMASTRAIRRSAIAHVALGLATILCCPQVVQAAIAVAITSPADGSIAAAGSSINVTATANSTDATSPVTGVMVTSGIVGAILPAPGYQATLTLPADFSGALTLTAFAKTNKTFGQSTPVTVLVIPNDTLSSIAVSPASFGFVAFGATCSLNVTGTYAGGETASLSDHRLGTTYATSASSVATISVDGLVTAVGPGTAQIAVKNGALQASVSITVTPATVTSPPVANAGATQTVAAGDIVSLDGSNSLDPNEQPLTYAWTQIGGSSVSLDDLTSATPSFIAPSSGGVLQFSLKVTDFSGLSSTASSTVAVSACGADPNHPCAGLASLTSAITAIGTQSGVAYADWTISNTGQGSARNVMLISVVPSVLMGTGVVSVDPASSPILPAALPDLSAGSSTIVRLFFDLPSSVSQFSITETGSYADARGTVHSFSMTENYFATSGNITVPNVVGTTQAAASTAITAAGLIVGTVTIQSSATVAAGLVVSESPSAGTSVVAKSAVNLVVSSGAARVSVPNVVGQTQAAATTVITGAGLLVGTVTTQSSATVVAGLVVSESPSAGTSVAAKSAVNLVVSSGAARVTVPNVVGQTQAAATTAITGAGLLVGTATTQSSATVAAGLVISESPSAGTSVAAKSPVELVVSNGSEALVLFRELRSATERVHIEPKELKEHLLRLIDEAEDLDHHRRPRHAVERLDRYRRLLKDADDRSIKRETVRQLLSIVTKLEKVLEEKRREHDDE